MDVDALRREQLVQTGCMQYLFGIGGNALEF